MKGLSRSYLLAAAMYAGCAMAADFDGSKNLICAPAQAMDCAEGVACVTGTPQELGAPVFLRIDFAKQTVTGTHRSSSIVQIEKTASQVVLQGFDEGQGWTIAINGGNGRMHAAMAGQDGAIILIGSCTTM